MYRAAQEAASEMREHLERGPPALLGLVAHRVMDRAFVGPITAAPGAASQTDHCVGVARLMWEEETRAVVRAQGGAERVGQPASWPNYSMKRARTVKAAAAALESRLGQAPISDAAEVYTEQPMECCDGRLVGRPDRIIVGPAGITVVDFKSGRIRDKSGQVQKRYRNQLLVYAHMVREKFGRWPSLVRLETIEEPPYEDSPSEQDSDQLIASMLAQLETYNRKAGETQGQPVAQAESLSAPGAESCRWCPVRPWCEPYWAAQTNLLTRTAHRADVDGRLASPWRPGAPMVLRPSAGPSLELAVNPRFCEGVSFLAQGTIIRCTSAKVVEDGRSYLADIYSDLWYREASA